MNDEWPSSSHDFCALSESAHIRLLLGAVALGECWYAAGSGSLWPERERERESMMVNETRESMMLKF